MTKLAPNLFRRRFQNLMEIGRAQLPSLAPEWTDYNAHDPGITLTELLAWVGEAQLYSLSRLRRDERLAYAALLGVTPRGTKPATGLIWPDLSDPNRPSMTLRTSVVIPDDAPVGLKDGTPTVFRPTHNLVWSPGRVVSLETRMANGQTIDHTFKNERGGVPFMPFGERPGKRDVLRITFASRDNSGLFGRDREAARGARWAIGVIASGPVSSTSGTSGTSGTSTPGGSCHSPLMATLVAGGASFPIRIVSDSTRGLLTTGSILLDLDAVTASSDDLRTVSVELSYRQTPARPPAVVRVEPNVIPIVQGRDIKAELHVSTGVPDWTFPLGIPGLRFGKDETPIEVEVVEPARRKVWTRSDRLSERGPNDDVYEFDTAKAEITFGNGVNGRVPPDDSQVFVTYSVSDGAEGNVARNRKWEVTGVDGTFGVNPDPVAGGFGASEWTDFRREARRVSRLDHALVSGRDIEMAAMELPLLNVERAWISQPDDDAPRTGVVKLVAMRGGIRGVASAGAAESRTWLEAIRQALLAKMPLGSRLAVVGPRYIDFLIQAEIEAEQNRDPSEIKTKVLAELETRLALTDRDDGTVPRQPGVPVTVRDVTAWIRAIDGVKRVINVAFIDPERREIDEVAVPGDGLPNWNSADSTIEVLRSRRGGSNGR